MNRCKSNGQCRKRDGQPPRRVARPIYRTAVSPQFAPLSPKSPGIAGSRPKKLLIAGDVIYYNATQSYILRHERNLIRLIQSFKLRVNKFALLFPCRRFPNLGRIKAKVQFDAPWHPWRRPHGKRLPKCRPVWTELNNLREETAVSAGASRSSLAEIYCQLPIQQICQVSGQLGNRVRFPAFHRLFDLRHIHADQPHQRITQTTCFAAGDSQHLSRLFFRNLSRICQHITKCVT